MHFKMYPDWTNCRSLTSDSDTRNSTVSFSQHQDSSTTVAAKVTSTKLLKSYCSMSWQSLDQNLRRSIIIIKREKRLRQYSQLDKVKDLES